VKLYTAAKAFSKSQYKEKFVEELAFLPDELKRDLDATVNFLEMIVNWVITIIDPFIKAIADMLYAFLLTGEV
jgi:hypothetical protein